MGFYNRLASCKGLTVVFVYGQTMILQGSHTTENGQGKNSRLGESRVNVFSAVIPSN